VSLFLGSAFLSNPALQTPILNLVSPFSTRTIYTFWDGLQGMIKRKYTFDLAIYKRLSRSFGRMVVEIVREAPFGWIPMLNSLKFESQG
jgi:hypothetical protein